MRRRNPHGRVWILVFKNIAYEMGAYGPLLQATEGEFVVFFGFAIVH